MKKTQWQFNEPPNMAVIVNKKILFEGDWIAYVSHDSDDGAWQFHTNQSAPVGESDAMLVSLQSIVNIDPSILLLADLPLGWHAWRDSKDADWQKMPITD